MSTETILTKTTRDGRTATVTLDVIRGGVTLTSRVGGKEIGSHVGPTHAVAGNAPEGYRGVGRLAITADEADIVDTAYHAAVAALPRDLRAERDALVDWINAVEDGAADDRAAAWDRFDGGGNPFRGDKAAEQRIADARARLTEVDAEHSEVAAQVEVERREMVQRAISS